MVVPPLASADSAFLFTFLSERKADKYKRESPAESSRNADRIRLRGPITENIDHIESRVGHVQAAAVGINEVRHPDAAGVRVFLEHGNAGFVSQRVLADAEHFQRAVDQVVDDQALAVDADAGRQHEFFVVNVDIITIAEPAV